jgi:hypothetical protein
VKGHASAPRRSACLPPEQLAEHGRNLGDGKVRAGVPGGPEVGLKLLQVNPVLREAARMGRRTFHEQALEKAARIGGGRLRLHEASRGFGEGWAVPVEIGVTLGVNMTFLGLWCRADNAVAAGAASRPWDPSQYPGLELLGSVGDASIRRGLARPGCAVIDGAPRV